MKWCMAVTIFVVAWYNVIDFCLAHPQQLQTGEGIPLTSLSASPQSPHSPPIPPTVSTSTSFQHDKQTNGVPLPQIIKEPHPNRQSNGDSLGISSVQNPSLSLGVPLPVPSSESSFNAGLPLLRHPVIAQLAENNNGVPLPSPDIFREQNVHSSSFGVPLPTHKGVHSSDINVLGSPSLIQGVAARKPVKNVNKDRDVQHAINLSSVHDYLQIKTKAHKAVKITDVISAYKQIVSGQILYLALRVGETKCPVGSSNIQNCMLDISEDDYVCEVALWERPWLNSSKVIIEKSRCEETEDDNDFKRWGPQALLPLPSSIEVTLQKLPHGVKEEEVGVEAFNYIDHGSESDFKGELIAYDLTSIKFDPLTNTTQIQVDVEYGFTLCLKSHDHLTDTRECPPDSDRTHYICSMVVLHNPNQLTSLEVIPILDDDDDIHCEKKRNVKEELVVPVVAPCSECPHPVPLNDPVILEVANFAIKEYDRISSEEDNLHIIQRISKAYSQILAGVRYYLVMEVAESLCKKTLIGVDINRTFCSQDPTEETKICDIYVIDQPWIPARDLLNARCYDKDSYLSSNHDEFIVPVNIGGSSGTADSSSLLLLPAESKNIFNTDKNSMEVVKFVVDEYNRREDDDEYYKLVQIHEISAETQGGNGRRYHVVAELGETQCDKRDVSTKENCPLDPTEEHEMCEADVYTESSSFHDHHSFRIITFKCDDLDDYLHKNFMPVLNPFDVMDHPFLDIAEDTSAGYKNVATNDSIVIDAAIFVVDQFNLRKDEDELFIFNRVISSLSQPSPNGITYHLELELAETQCKKYQFVAAPSRCPVDHSEEVEVCQAEVLIPQVHGGAMQLIKLYCDEVNDYYTRNIRGGGAWMNASVNDETLKKLGHLIANEYDLRSDEDSLYIFHKILKARKQITFGIKYQLVVELLETVCPKYKRRINKARCAPDIGEDPVICEAHVFSQPWFNKNNISHLQCAEKDDFFEGNESVEILYPRVHPSAHARPVFRSHFIIRTSDESEESNERFYDPSRRSSASRSQESKEDDSDERFYHPSGRSNSHRADTDEDDSNERHRSHRG